MFPSGGGAALFAKCGTAASKRKPMKRFGLALILFASSASLSAKDSLGIFDDWGAFRDAGVPRCYAISAAEGEARDQPAYAAIGIWPGRQIRGQVHIRLSRSIPSGGGATLRIGNRRFRLGGGGPDAWAEDTAMDAAIITAMRAENRMWVTARDRSGRRFTDSYSLAGAATAMDAAQVGCARSR
ncbi:hypothetical protein WYH_00146 [Croceibacterium atlanticum]|uniref:Mlr4354 like protein n=2 Tax=Croceibacterium atlanticum TaxID=1267766 RepID=A0A0F7KQ10_9SPHN|nr:hypothetical protein WYH_00146 [Croceibacterium atlanticum]